MPPRKVELTQSNVHQGIHKMILASHIFLALWPLAMMLTAKSATALRLSWRCLVVFGFISIVWSIHDVGVYALAVWAYWLGYAFVIRFTVLKWKLMKVLPVENRRRVEKILERAQEQLRTGTTT